MVDCVICCGCQDQLFLLNSSSSSRKDSVLQSCFIKFSSQLNHGFENYSQVDYEFTDFSKAFDRVSYKLILPELDPKS